MMLALFSFRGRIGRMAYVGWTFASLGLVIVCIAVAVVAMMTLGFRDSSFARGEPGFFVVALPAFAGVVWTSTALMVKRCRDIGIPPLAFVLAVTSLGLLDQWILERIVELRVTGFLGLKGTPLGAILSFTPVVLAVCPSTLLRRQSNGADRPHRAE